MNKAELKAGYDDVKSLYSIADELAITAEDSQVMDINEYFDVIEPLITEVSEASEVLTDEYISVIDEPARSKNAKAKVEKALRKLFMALDNYRTRLQETANELVGVLSALASPVISKLQKQAEKITLMFMQLMEISLDRIMRKNELDEFKRNNTHFLVNMQQQLAH